MSRWRKWWLGTLVAGSAAVVCAGCGTEVIAHCKSGVSYIVPHTGKGGEGGSASLVVCRNGTIWRIDP